MWLYRPRGHPARAGGGNRDIPGQAARDGSDPVHPRERRPASGDIKDGRFTLSTYAEGDGAIPGEAKVGDVSTIEIPSKKSTDAKTRDLIPEKYGKPDTSNLVVKIPPGGKTDILIELK